MRPLLLLLAMLAAGCMEEAGATVGWTVRNDSDQELAYTLLLEGDGGRQRIDGSAGPGQVRHHEMRTNATDLMATAQVRDEPRESAGVPFSIDGLCGGHRVEATWDGQTWSVDAASECA